MTKKHYKNPPIKEVICEFKFEQTSWDPAIPGIMYERLKDKFPSREFRKDVETQLEINEQNVNPSVKLSDRSLFKNDNGNIVVQIGKNHLVLNHIQPYTGWDEFLGTIEHVFRMYLDVAGPNSIERIEQRYINEINFPDPEVQLENYFDFYPHIGFQLENPFNSFVAGIQIPFGNDIQKIQMTSLEQSIILDNQYFTGLPKSIEFNNAIKWLNNAHDRNISAFEGCIKQSLREKFAEV